MEGSDVDLYSCHYHRRNSQAHQPYIHCTTLQVGQAQAQEGVDFIKYISVTHVNTVESNLASLRLVTEIRLFHDTVYRF